MAACPAHGAGHLRRHWVCNFNRVLEDDREDCEAGRAQQGGDDVGAGDAGGARREDEDDVADRNDGDEHFCQEQVVLVAVCDGGDYGRGDKANDNQQGAGDAGFSLAEAIRLEDLVEQGGYAVEAADVSAEGNEDDPEFEGADEF